MTHNIRIFFLVALLPGGCFAPGSGGLFKSDPPAADSAKKDDKKDDPNEPKDSLWQRFQNWRTPPAPEGAADTLVLRGDHLENDKAPPQIKGAETLAGAHELYRIGDFHKAEKIFANIANNTKNSPAVAEEARYYEAECLRRQMRYPKASDTYNKLLNDFPSGAYREQATQRMYDIADVWLEDTRNDMQQYKEKREGKRWVVWPQVFHTDKWKPLIDEEGRAIEKLEQVNYNDMNGPLADKSLFLAGSVKFFREDYREADHYFTMLIEHHPNSPLAPRALELAITSKHLSTGGSDYDGRKVAEARVMVDKALRNYPELANEKRDFLEHELVGITWQQAEKDFKVAEFYRRTGHPGSAYFYYEIVRRRYPNTPYFDQATEKMLDMRAKLEKEREKGKDTEKAALPAPPKKEPTPKASSGSEQAPAPRRLPAQPEVAPPPRTLPPDTQMTPRTMPPTSGAPTPMQ